MVCGIYPAAGIWHLCTSRPFGYIGEAAALCFMFRISAILRYCTIQEYICTYLSTTGCIGVSSQVFRGESGARHSENLATAARSVQLQPAIDTVHYCTHGTMAMHVGTGLYASFGRRVTMCRNERCLPKELKRCRSWSYGGEARRYSSRRLPVLKQDEAVAVYYCRPKP